MAGRNRMVLTLDAVLKIRDLYAERDPVHKHLPKYTHAQIAGMMDCSSTTVLRVINREGAYAFVGGQSMGEVKADPRGDAEMAQAARESLERLKHLQTTMPVEDQPVAGATLSPETQAAADAVKQKLGNL